MFLFVQMLGTTFVHEFTATPNGIYFLLSMKIVKKYENGVLLN